MQAVPVKKSTKPRVNFWMGPRQEKNVEGLREHFHMCINLTVTKGRQPDALCKAIQREGMALLAPDQKGQRYIPLMV